MKLKKSFFILLLILFILCTSLYFITKNTTREGLAGDTDPNAIADAQPFKNDPKFAGTSGYLKILPFQNTVSNEYRNYQNINNLAISQYAVKSSYNSACSGGKNNYISCEMLMYTLSRGCRFIDFEIASIGDIPSVISQTNDIVTGSCGLTDILKTVNMYGLGSATGSAPNSSDPLFIHLRINYDANSKNNIYSDVAKCIKTVIGSNLINGVNLKNSVNSDLSTTADYLKAIVKPFIPDNKYPTNDVVKSLTDFLPKLQAAANANPTIITIGNAALPKTMAEIDNIDKKKPSLMSDFLNIPEIRAFINLPILQTYISTITPILNRLSGDTSNMYYLPAKRMLSFINTYISVTGSTSNNLIDVNTTKLNDIMGKVIIILDSNYDKLWRTNAQANAGKNFYDLTQYVHLESGNDIVTLNSPSTISQQPAQPIVVKGDGLSVTNNTLQIILPETDVGILNTSKISAGINPDFKNLVTNWGCNFVTNRFYMKDDFLNLYENFFNMQQIAIVPLSRIQSYYLALQNNGATQ
jgi:hypothetical protein